MSQIFTRALQLLDDDPYARYNGIKLISIDKNSASLELVIQKDQVNFLGGAHGGCLFTLADTAFGLTANCAVSDTVSVGIDTHMAFFKGCRIGELIRANASEVSRSQKTAVYRVDLLRDSELIATFTGTVYITGRKVKETD